MIFNNSSENNYCSSLFSRFCLLFSFIFSLLLSLTFSFIFTCLVSPLSSSRFFSFIVSSSFSVSLCLCLSFSLCLSLFLSVSVSVSVSCCVLWCCGVCSVPVCTFKTPPCVRSKRLCVPATRPHVTTVSTCARGAGIQGDVLNPHTDVFGMDTRRGGRGGRGEGGHRQICLPWDGLRGDHVLQRGSPKETLRSYPFKVWE